jgi:hypothetical protein
MSRVHAEPELREGSRMGVRARLRPLQEEEAPPGTAQADCRMVEYFCQEGGQVWPDRLDPETEYQPLRTPELLGEFLHVFGGERSPSDAAVTSFYARFGPITESVPRDGKPFPAWAERLEPEAVAGLSVAARLLLCEPVWWLRERARDLRLTYDIYLALVEDRKAFLRSLLGDLSPRQRLRKAQIVGGRIIRDVVDALLPPPSRRASSPEAKRVSLRTWEAQRDEYSARVAADLLADQLNKAEAQSRRLWVVTGRAWARGRKGEPAGQPRPDALRLVRTRYVSDLVTAMYLQLGECVEGRTILRQCPGCDRLFYPARRNQEYCTARCGDAARQRLYYRARQQRLDQSQT